MSLALGYAYEDPSKLTQSSFIVGISLSQKGGVTTVKLKPTWSFNVIVEYSNPEHGNIAGLPPKKNLNPGSGHGKWSDCGVRYLASRRVSPVVPLGDQRVLSSGPGDISGMGAVQAGERHEVGRTCSLVTKQRVPRRQATTVGRRRQI